MKRKKKSFYFKDYTETKIPEQNFNFKIAKVSYSRIVFLSFIFLTILTICSIKIFYLSLSDEKNFYSKNTQVNFSKDRRDIVDRNGNILATNVNLYDVGIRPSLIVDKEKKNLLINLSLLVPDLEIEKISNDLLNNKTELVPYGDEILNQAKEAAFQLYEDMSTKDAGFRQLYEGWQKFRKDISSWNTINFYSKCRN